MQADFIQKLYHNHQTCPGCPSTESVSRWFDALLEALIPDFAQSPVESPEQLEAHFHDLQTRLAYFLGKVPLNQPVEAEEITHHFFKHLPVIHERLEQAVNCLYKGDPAAKSRTEVIRTYPGFFAIAAHRVAHALHLGGAELIPRMISEYAHSKTGIDIHPAAQIGDYFCIDHGTGVVIGETTVIGHHVKVYQGVTLGALSVKKEDAAIKRHPTIGNHVIIYSGATILGGQTVIGDHSTIGGNVWLTESVPAHSKIYYKAQMSNTEGGADTIVIKAPAE